MGVAGVEEGDQVPARPGAGGRPAVPARRGEAERAEYSPPLDRIVLSGVGCLLIALAIWQLRDTERLLLGVRAVKTRESEAS